jgi:hypothetical protein
MTTYIVIWKDKHGRIHRDIRESAAKGYLVYYYTPFPYMWWDYQLRMHIEQPERTLLYLFKVKP